jgi:quercetin dioxygenase-like cupin family protein
MQNDVSEDPQPAPAGTPAQARTIRRRLMERVADADDSHVTIAPDDEGWQPFMEGVTMRVLRERDGVLSYLLRLAPGAAVPSHRHPMDEECIVIEGRIRVGSQATLGPGAYHLAHEGSLHPSISTQDGATIFLRGAVPEADQLL